MHLDESLRQTSGIRSIFKRKERWGFLEIPWHADKQTYEVAVPYTDVRMSIFNDFAHTMRVVKPFVWNDTYLKVHPNGAAVFAEDKKLAFLLPSIVEAHALIPPTPIFWVKDDKTIPLARTTLWLHDRTIQWLAATGEAYPPELRNEIQPRLGEIKLSRPAKRLQPPPPPKATRWQEKSKEKLSAQASQEPAAQPSPQQLADHERQYMNYKQLLLSWVNGQLQQAGQSLNNRRNQPNHQSRARLPQGKQTLPCNQ